MKFTFRAGIVGMIGLAALAAGCSSSGGGILDNPSGSIVITDAATGRVLHTSETNPYPVPALNFTIDASEAHFDGPYTVKIIDQENLPTPANGGAVYGFTFSQPCFTVTQVANLTSNSVPISFNGQNANGEPANYPDGGVPTPGPGGVATTSSGNPCHSGEFEVAQISDTDGHSVNFYYEELP